MKLRKEKLAKFMWCRLLRCIELDLSSSDVICKGIANLLLKGIDGSTGFLIHADLLQFQDFEEFINGTVISCIFYQMFWNYHTKICFV